MSEPVILLQYVTQQRDQRPAGLRIWSDGSVQHAAPDNALPGPTQRIDVDREIQWQDQAALSPTQVETLQGVMRECGLFDLPAKLLINYCKDDPGTTIWMANLDGKMAHIIVYDPRPKRSAELDKLLTALNELLPVA